jgi:hypothetical protein
MSTAYVAHVCNQCGQANRIVNECRCDPNNLPTLVNASEPQWTDEDARQSVSQGWSIFSILGRDPAMEARIVNGRPYGYRPYEIMTVLDEGIFADDEEAWDFVKFQVASGDALALRAAEFLRANSPCEYKAVFEARGRR